MDAVRKVLVHVLSKEIRAAPQRAHFLQSITGYFNNSMEDQAVVTCSLEDNRFILSAAGQTSGPLGRHVPLKRAPFCPFKHLSVTEAAAIPLDVQQRGVDVGVAVLLQSANQRVLLTRRAAGLRIFPNIWVPPGGHIELDEQLLEAGLRELREETGIKLEPEDVSPELLGLWESVYPAMLSRGKPHRHHIVTYMLLHTNYTHVQLQEQFSPCPEEVSGCLWAEPLLVRAMVSAVDGEESDVLLAGLPPSVSVCEVSPDGSLALSELPVSVLCSRVPSSGPDVERVSTGTKFALELWLETL